MNVVIAYISGHQATYLLPICTLLVLEILKYSIPSPLLRYSVMPLRQTSLGYIQNAHRKNLT